MASIAGLLHHHSGHANAAVPAVSSTASEAGGAGTANVSSNDFLTLLVTELKNQDPTANADPNQYVNQLVQVNSLEQLININETLSTRLNPKPAGEPAGMQGASANHVRDSHVAADGGVPVASGNLSTPAFNPAAHKIAQALSGRTSHRL